MISTRTPDPSWAIDIQQRKAVLWIGPESLEFASVLSSTDFLVALFKLPWAAIYVDATNIPIGRFCEDHKTIGDLQLRFIENDPSSEPLPPNRLPVYYLRGPKHSVLPNSTNDPVGLMRRYSMLKQIPKGCEIFAIGVASLDAGAGLIEAFTLSPGLHTLVIAGQPCPQSGQLDPLLARFINWTNSSWSEFATLLVALPSDNREAVIRVKTVDGYASIDLSKCIEPSHPIDATFSLIPEHCVLDHTQPTENDLSDFLFDPCQSWLAYSGGLVFHRNRTYEASVLKILKRIIREGVSASCTAWITAEDSSGATTLLRQLSFAVARDGLPVLIARPSQLTFDLRQLSVFLTHATTLFATHGALPGDTPWTIVFDAEHTQSSADFVGGLANAMMKLQKPVLVIGVRTPPNSTSATRIQASGKNRDLEPLLLNSITIDEGLALGTHLSQFLSASRRRAPEEWRAFIGESARSTIEGNRSLFWLSLRFWLFRAPGVETTFRKWLAAKFLAAAGNHKGVLAGLLEVAVLSTYRLPTPLSSLPSDVCGALQAISRDKSNPLGLAIIGRQYVVYTHPLVAEELLRLAITDTTSLAAIDISTCLGLLDLELHLLERIVTRPTGGRRECIVLIEELITTALRIDPRESPRNYSARDRIVNILENAPSDLYDTSQVFNHHVAKARRHLALDPPSSDWSYENRRSQLTLAEKHLLDAIKYIRLDDDDRLESKLNLTVSLALTYDAIAKLAEGVEPAEAAIYRQKAEDAYSEASRLDADSPYVLENFARFKLRQARATEPGERRMSLVIEAIALLEWELESQDNSSREIPATAELASAFGLLDEAESRGRLASLAEQGSEAGLLALAKLAMRIDADSFEVSRDQLLSAESYILKIPSIHRSWRTRFMHYQIIRKLRPYEFSARLDLLEDLYADDDFSWPLQFRVEHAILLFQSADDRSRAKGNDLFARVRDELSSHSGSVSISEELRLLRDPRKQFKDPLKTFIRVSALSEVGRSSFGIPDGWRNVRVAFREYRFPKQHIRLGEELDCFIQFSTFGPQAIPVSSERD